MTYEYIHFYYTTDNEAYPSIAFNDCDLYDHIQMQHLLTALVCHVLFLTQKKYVNTHYTHDTL